MGREKTCCIVADYGVGDAAFTEVARQVRFAVPGVQIDNIAVAPFNVTEAAFQACQSALHVPQARAQDDLVFVNVDPRDHTIKPIADGRGAPLYFGVLKNGGRILGPGAATFMVAQHLGILHAFAEIPVDLFVPNGQVHGQFRSRDIYPRVIAEIFSGRLEDDLRSVDKDIQGTTRDRIPKLTPRVLFVDGYGNIVTSIRASEQAGSLLDVRIGSRALDMPRTEGLFSVPPGALHCYPGSSGLPDNPFLEIAVRYSGNGEDSAAARFSCPEPGSPITIHELTMAKGV